MAGGEDSSTGLFSQCSVSILLSKDITVENQQQLCSTLESNGATVVENKADGTIDLSTVTHIISTTCDFPQYPKACDRMIPVVTPAWITQSLLRNKQAQIRPFTPDPRLIFSGIVLSTADLPTGDQDAIIGAVLAMGGQYSSGLTKLVTHIAALTDDTQKVQQAREKRLKCKVILPHWFDDCLKLGKRIDETPYMLPNPEILRLKPEDDLKIPSTAHIESSMSPHPEVLPRLQVSTTTRKLDVFNNKKVLLCDDLCLSKRLRSTIADLVAGGGGDLTDSVHFAHMYIGRYRDGRDYTFAARIGIDVGNLSWLYHLITTNEWTSPFRRLLHYPLPRYGIPGFEQFRITLSNYGGEARVYLENLVVAAGGEFTKSMKQDNTHLITARKNSEKCAAAEEWNIEMVNHLWIEESYARCEVQKLSNPRYTHFPPRTNLGEVIGETYLNATILEELYYPKDPEMSPEEVKQARLGKEARSRSAKALQPPVASNVIQPHPKTDNGKEAEDLSSDSQLSAIVPSRPKSNLPTTPSVMRLSSRDKENETPSSTSSRGAKDRALSKLHDLAPDLALYEKEKKRASAGGVWGGKRAADRIDQTRGKKRSASLSSEGDDGLGSESEAREVKKAKTVRPSVAMRLLITGYKRWIQDSGKEEKDRKKLRDLGISVTQDPTACTHLAAPSIVRTKKFLCALAGSGPTIISSDFIDTCLESGSIPDAESFLLNDKVNEKRFGLKLKDVINRAQNNHRKLLKGVVVYCTSDIPNGPDTYKDIVEANGATFNVYRARGGATIKPSGPDSDDEMEPVYLLSGTKVEEKRLWPKFVQMAEQGGMEPRIVQTEWLLDTAMAQELRWDKKYLLRAT